MSFCNSRCVFVCVGWKGAATLICLVFLSFPLDSTHLIFFLLIWLRVMSSNEGVWSCMGLMISNDYSDHPVRASTFMCVSFPAICRLLHCPKYSAPAVVWQWYLEHNPYLNTSEDCSLQRSRCSVLVQNAVTIFEQLIFSACFYDL